MNELRIGNWAAAVAMLAAVVLSLTGCQGKSEDSANNDASKPAATQASQPATAANVEASPLTTTQASQPTTMLAPAGFSLNRAQFDADMAVLTKNPNRLAGRPDGSIAASKYVQQRLVDMGLAKDDVYAQEFDLFQPVTTEARLVMDNKEVTAPAGRRAIYQMRHNFLQAPITPREGLTGECVYVGKGTLAEYGTSIPQDKIVVMDFDSGKNWLKAFAFGAKAVVFVGPQDALATNAWHHLNVPANLPRFFIQQDIADQLGLRVNAKAKRITIFAASQWERFRGRNVITVVQGTDPRYGANAKDKNESAPQAMLLAAPLDSLSEVPELSPGARDAANVAVLLQMAQYFKEHPARRNIILCFFDGQTVSNTGAQAFYGALNRGKKGVNNVMSLEAKLADLQTEKTFIQNVLKILAVKDFFSQEAVQAAPDCYDRTSDIIKSEAINAGGDILDELRPLRVRNEDINRSIEHILQKDMKADGANVPALQAQVDALKAEAARLAPDIARLTKLDTTWNKLQGDLHESKPGKSAITDPADKENSNNATRPRFNELIVQMKDLYGRRLTEIDDQIKDVNQGIVLRNRFGTPPKAPDKPQGGMQVMLHVSVNLGDARARWTFIHGDDSGFISQDLPGAYNAIDKTMQKVAATLNSNGKGMAHFDVQAVTSDYTDSRLFAPALFVDSGAIARLFAIFNVSTMTVLDAMGRQGLPGDTLKALDADAILTQAAEAATFLHALADENGLNVLPSTAPPATYVDAHWNNDKHARRLEGAAVKKVGGGQAMRTRPVRSAIVAITKRGTGPWNGWPIEKTAPGFDVPILAQSNIHGIFEVGPFNALAPSPWFNGPVVCALFDEYQPQIPRPAGLDPKLITGPTARGLITTVSDNDKLLWKELPFEKNFFTVFETRPFTAVGYGFDRGTIVTQVMRAQSTAAFRSDHSMSVEFENVLTVFAPYESKGLKVFNKSALVFLNNTKTKPEGDGISLENPYEHPLSCELSAHDLLALNENRLDILSANRITQDDLQNSSQHSREQAEQAQDIRRQLAQAATQPTSQPATAPAGGIARTSWGHYFGNMEASAALSRRVYIPLVGVMNDLVTAVVLLLLLALPFAFALERLIIGTPHIYRQIAWFGVFFLLTFGVLFLVNPAFKIAATPIVIFLAFTIILLSVLVIFIMIRKLQAEVRKMQGLASTVHATDVSRLSTMMAAVSMGISTMRRRPLRTLLTSVTVVLLTFTILTFASFGSSWGVNQQHIGPMSGATPRIMVRHQIYMPIREEMVDTLQGSLSDQGIVIPRFWVSPVPQDVFDVMASQSSLDILLARGDAGKKTLVSAAIGIDSRDFDLLRPPASLEGAKSSDLEGLFEGDVSLIKTNGLFMTKANADALGLTAQDRGHEKVLFKGQTFVFAGLIREGMGSYNVLEGSSPLPVDYKTSIGPGGTLQTMINAQQQNTQSLSEMPDQPNAQFVPYSVDKVVVIGAQAAQALRGTIRTATIYPTDPAQLKDIAERAASITELPTYAGDANGVYRMVYGPLASVSGVKDLMIPVLLGGLIVFATMLGSVSDREREIYTFSSLGLAPPHVASLFFAEASMYAVIGGMGGYLLGQVVARLMGVLSSTFGFNVPTMNYSSTNAIVTVLIVMSTVLISTIYPAMKASHSANPGIQRSWKIPKPLDNLFDLVFPFTVSAYDIVGVVSFLKEHFDNYSDTSLGVFTTAQSGIFRQGNEMLGFKAKVALAPFDLGVNQNFAMLSQPSDIEGINEVRILISRLSGAQGDWQRANRVFINDLRKQLLIWRSLPPEIMERYRQKTLEIWNELPVESIDKDSIGGAL